MSPVKRIIPDSYTDYEDGHLGVVAASLANVEIKIGPAEGGQPYKLYTLSGPDAKKQAKTLFKGGPLLRHIEAAFDAGSTRIIACRIGNAARATIDLKNIAGVAALRLKTDYRADGNNNFANVVQTLTAITPAYLALCRSTNRIQRYDADMQLLGEIALPAAIVTPVGVDAPVFKDGSAPYRVVGYGSTTTPMLWELSSEGAIVRSLSLAAVVPSGDTLVGLGSEPRPKGELIAVTDKNVVFIDISGETATLIRKWSYTDDLGAPSAPDVSSICVALDLAATTAGEETTRRYLLLNRTEKSVIVVERTGNTPAMTEVIDLAGQIGGDIPEGIAYDYDSGNILIAVRNEGTYPYSRLLRFSVVWGETSVFTYVGTENIGQNAYGLASHVAAAELVTTLTIQDRNTSPVTTSVFNAVGTFDSATAALAALVNAAGVYEAEVLLDSPSWLSPSLEGGDGVPDPTQFDAFSGGADSGTITNANYLAGLEATRVVTEASWIHAVEASTEALWTAILLHCDEMERLHQAERFAILETPAFSSVHIKDSAGYLTDVQTYVDSIKTRMQKYGDRNACVFPAGARFTNSDGNSVVLPLTASCGGTMAGLEVQKSLINKPVKGVLELIPEFTPGQIETLIQSRVNCVRFKPGRGFIIAHSLTAAAPGSDYSRVNDLRAVYYAAKAAREAAQPYVGEENDEAGEGLRKLESAMSRPVEQMRDAGQIDDFELEAVSDETNRLLGDVYVSLGIKPLRAMEMIYTTVYLK